MRCVYHCVCLLLAGAASPALAQVTQAYSYDANGRLEAVGVSGAAGTNSVGYAYDDANNRTYRSQSGSTAYAALSRMPADHPLLPHQALVSADGAYSLALRSSGRLELWFADASAPSGLASVFEVTSEGEARFLAPDRLEVQGTQLALAEDGALLMLGDNEKVLWRSDAARAREVEQ
jgi:glucose/arabinose dehydrogenase